MDPGDRDPAVDPARVRRGECLESSLVAGQSANRVRQSDGRRLGVAVAARDGSGGTVLAPVVGTNHHFGYAPVVGEPLAWSPNGNQIAFVSRDAGS